MKIYCRINSNLYLNIKTDMIEALSVSEITDMRIDDKSLLISLLNNYIIDKENIKLLKDIEKEINEKEFFKIDNGIIYTDRDTFNLRKIKSLHYNDEDFKFIIDSETYQFFLRKEEFKKIQEEFIRVNKFTDREILSI